MLRSGLCYLNSVSHLQRSCALLTGFKLSGKFLRHFVPWPRAKFYGDRSREPIRRGIKRKSFLLRHGVHNVFGTHRLTDSLTDGHTRKQTVSGTEGFRRVGIKRRFWSIFTIVESLFTKSYQTMLIKVFSNGHTLCPEKSNPLNNVR